MRYEILKWENEIATLLKGLRISLFVKTSEEIEGVAFENLEFKKAEVSGNDGILVFGDENIIEILGEYINANKTNLFDSLNTLKEAFKKKTKDLLKFRGDLAEAIFIYKLGGIKIFDGASADVNRLGEMIEVKSFSPQKKTIKISLEQLSEHTSKYAVELLMDSTGIDIIELSNSFKDNSDFKKYLKEEYRGTIYENLKFKLSTPICIDNKMRSIKLNENVINASFEILIK